LIGVAVSPGVGPMGAELPAECCSALQESSIAQHAVRAARARIFGKSSS